MEFRSVVALSEFEEGRRPRKEDEMLFPGLNHGLELSQSFHFSNAGALAENSRWVSGAWFSVLESVFCTHALMQLLAVVGNVKME